MRAQRLELPRLYIKFKIKIGDNSQFRAVSIPIKINRKRSLGVAIKMWRNGPIGFPPVSKQFYLKKDGEFPKIPDGYKWALECITTTPDSLNDYLKKALEIVEKHMAGEIVEAFIKKFT